MGFLDDLQQSLGIFNQGVQQLSTQRAISQANDQVQAIRDSSLAEDQKQQEFRNLAQDLTLKMTAQGASAAHIQNIASAFAPKPPTLQTPEEAVLMGNQAQQDRGNKLIQEKRNFELKKQASLLQNKTDIATAKGIESKNKALDKGFDQLNQALDSNKARGGELAKSQGVLNRITRLEGIFQQFPDNNIPKAQSAELATGLASIYSGGTPQSQEQIRLLMPQGSASASADVKTWFLNDPQGQGQQKAIQLLKEGSARERAIVEDTIKQARLQRLPAFAYLKEADPVRYNNTLQGYGLSSSEQSTVSQQFRQPNPAAAGFPAAPDQGLPSAQIGMSKYYTPPIKTK